MGLFGRSKEEKQLRQNLGLLYDIHNTLVLLEANYFQVNDVYGELLPSIAYTLDSISKSIRSHLNNDRELRHAHKYAHNQSVIYLNAFPRTKESFDYKRFMNLWYLFNTYQVGPSLKISIREFIEVCVRKDYEKYVSEDLRKLKELGEQL